MSSPGERERLFLAMQSYGLQLLLVSISVAFCDLACNLSKFDSRRLCHLSFSQFQTQTSDFLIVGEFLTFNLVLRTADSQAFLETLLRVPSTLFLRIIFCKVVYCDDFFFFFFFPLILRLPYSASAAAHYKLLSNNLCFPLSCRYFRFKNNPVEMNFPKNFYFH